MMTPMDLRTEGLLGPLNIDTNTPRLSWAIPDRGIRGCRQVSWRIELEVQSCGLIWDSGIQAGDAWCVQCPQGLLASFSAYRWRVLCSTAAGIDGSGVSGGVPECGGVSDWATFETAALEASALRAQWIAHPAPESYYEGEWESGVPNQKSALESSLHYRGIYCSGLFPTPDQPLRRARVLVAAGGIGILYLNGVRVSDELLSPPQTDYRAGVLYSVYDLGPYLDTSLQDQCLSLALGNGRHIGLYGFGTPRGYVQVFLEREDGVVETFVSDASWRVGTGPIRENSLFNGETYDARIPVPKGRADLEGLPNAEPTDGYPLRAALLPPIRVDLRLSPVTMTRVSEGYLFDFGQNFSGAAELFVDLPRGTELRLRFAELVDADGNLNPASNRAARSEDRFIASGVGPEIWRPETSYHGFRYLLLDGYPGVPPSGTVTGLFFHTEVERSGDFHCSHELFNRIHRNILWGQLSNLMGLPTDSPQRDERHGWLGDALLSAEECLLNFGAAGFWEKFVQDMADTQNKDGSITDVAPKFWMAKSADPAWGSAFISLPWALYRFRGDESVLRKHYESFVAYLGFLESQATNHIIEGLGTFGDWCAPGMVVPKKTSLAFTSTWYFQHDAGLMADIAAVLGRSEDAVRFRALRDDIVAAMNGRFFVTDHYETLPLSPWDFPDQSSQAMALCSPMVHDEARGAVAASLDRLVTAESGDHVGTGIHGTRYLLEALTDSGYGEKAFTVAAQETYPGWGYMVREGATTLWERWEKIEVQGMNSHNHIMLGSIDLWFYGSVAGLRVSEGGGGQLIFKPALLSRVDYAYARIQTERGPASSSWYRQKGKVVLDARIPPGSSGSVFPPPGYAISSASSTPTDGVPTDLPLDSTSPLSLDSGWYRLIIVPRENV